LILNIAFSCLFDNMFVQRFALTQKYFFTTQSLNMFVFSSTMRIQTYLGLTQYPCNKLRAESLTPLKRFDYRLS
jgi:hypothetical protein